jgi:hypothetical protein
LMLKKTSSLALLVLHLMLWLPSPASAQTGADPRLAERVKAEVAALGAGVRVSIKLRGKKQVTGYISEIGESEVVVTKAKEGTKQTIAYADITQLKQKNEKRISTAGKVLIVWGVMGVIGLIATGGGG